MATKYLNLRFKFGGILVSEVGPVYVGGKTEYVKNVDEDHMSILELADYVTSFGISKLGKTYAKSLGGDLVELKNDMDICNIALFMHDGDTIDIYVCDDTILEDVRPNEEWTDTEEEGEPTVQQGTKPSIQEEVEPSAQESAEEDINSDSICSNQSIDYGSDVHEELRIVKEDVREFKESRRRKKKEKNKMFFSGEVGLDEGFQSDEEEPVSDDELERGSLRGRNKSNRVIYDSTCDVVIWQCGLVFESVKEFREAVTKYAIKKGVELDKYVNESTRVRVKCKSGCPWLLYASKKGRSENFTIKTYNPRHKCCNTSYPKIEISESRCYRWHSRTQSMDRRWTHNPSYRSVVRDRKLPQNSVRKFG
ncbi:hypothetical protein KY284_016583 [Solanum tuberosum]|nr:hypothetical protein KY284_016583 [Solanum tuberosum]